MRRIESPKGSEERKEERREKGTEREKEEGINDRGVRE